MSRILLLLVSIFFCPPVFAESSHASLFVKTVEEFSIFPGEQPNNTVYRDGKLVLQSPSVQWLDLIQIKGTDSWLVSGIDEEGKYQGHLLLNEKDKLVMTNQGYGVYDILKQETGILEIYRTHKGQLEIIKTKYKSVRSPTASLTHLVFAHIRDSRKERNKQIFEFRLHLIRHDSIEIKSLKLYPKDESAKLEMDWIDKSKIQIRYHDGKTKTFDLKKYAPTLF
ncbi:MAG: hypothetical protein P8O70_15315 [SAR324 cluster bacterium]|nr:hypothetical protein [SAR324 cluster bacterium]